MFRVAPNKHDGHWAIRPSGIGWLLVWVLQSSVPVESPETISFNRHIRPLLAEHCLHCQGPDASQRKGDLRLDLEAADRSTAIVAGNP